MQVTRRQFFRICAVGVGSSSLAALGFAPGEALAEVRAFKLARTTETRNTCPYCSVGCGLLMYSLGDNAGNTPGKIIHIEGDPDHPVNRGTLCPKGAGLLDFVNSPHRLQYPQYRAPGSKEWTRKPGNTGIRQSGACLTRPDGGKSCPDVWPRSDDQPLG